MTTRTEYTLRVHWADGRTHQPYTPMGTDNVKAEMDALPKSLSNRIHYASPGADRWKLRSTSYAGIARAMADQWAPTLTTERSAA